ncbi:hypothetical protein SERLA73DRAFT_142237, partial [Serpula lacrymans var. lacrymans S7.3]
MRHRKANYHNPLSSAVPFRSITRATRCECIRVQKTIRRLIPVIQKTSKTRKARLTTLSRRNFTDLHSGRCENEIRDA